MTDTPASLLGFEYQALIDDVSKKSIGFQSTISKDCSQQELDALLDKCRTAVTRQRIFAEIEAKTIDLRNLEESLVRGQKDLADEDKRYAERADGHEGRAARGLSTAEQKVRQDKISNLVNGVALRDSVKGKLYSLRAMVGQDKAGCPTLEAQGLTPVNINGEQVRWSDNGGASPG
jgi:hypothetical protein